MTVAAHTRLFLLCGLAGAVLGGGCRSTPPLSSVPARTLIETPVRLPLDPTLAALPSVQVQVNEAPPRLFIVDTGTSGLMLSRRFLSETRPQFLDTPGVMETPAGARDMGAMCHVARIRMGGAEFRDITACTADLSNIESSLNRELGGVIGIGVFADCRITLDYPADGLLLVPAGARTREDDAGRGIVLPLRLSETGLPLVPLSIHGTTVWAIVDSGSSRAFSLPYDLIEQLGRGDAVVRAPGTGTTFHGSATVDTAQLRDSIFLGPREFLNPVVHVEAGQPRIGHRILRQFIVAIDIRNKQIRFTRAPRV